MSKIVHRETIPLRATPEQVRQFIMTPERILDYYPNGVEGAVLEQGERLYCRSKSGVSLLERLAGESSDEKVVIEVTTALNLKPPYTVERIKAARFFTMIEDWELEATDEGSLLTKTWRDVHKYRLRLMPVVFLVRRGAKAETVHLQSAWNEAAAG